MTDRERMLAAIRGEPVDRIAFVPRLEFWYRARRRHGTLPPELRSLTLPQIVQHLNLGYYAVVPDFTDIRDETHMIDRALGLFQLPTLAYDYVLEGVERSVTRHGGETAVEYRTPAGVIRTAFVFTPAMLDGGASMPWTTAEPIRQPADFDVVRYIFENIQVRPHPEGYLELKSRVGDRGLAIGYTLGTACPMQHIMKELMTTERFFYALADYPDKVQQLAEAMELFYASMKRIVADSPAEVVLLGGNYDDSITYPAFFRKHILPALQEYAGDLHRRNKFLLTHTDGENRGLMPLYLEAGFDVADSVCPYPMTSLTLEEILEWFRGRITVLGGIPSILLCPDSARFEDFRRFIDDLIERHGRDTRLILGVSDMVTADCEWDRLRYIADKVHGLL